MDILSVWYVSVAWKLPDAAHISVLDLYYSLLMIGNKSDTYRKQLSNGMDSQKIATRMDWRRHIFATALSLANEPEGDPSITLPPLPATDGRLGPTMCLWTNLTLVTEAPFTALRASESKYNTPPQADSKVYRDTRLSWKMVVSSTICLTFVLTVSHQILLLV
jgi:hypothetical protein